MRNRENIERRRVAVNGRRIFALVAENRRFAAKPRLVLVQGLAIAARYWAPAIAELSAHFNVYAPDLPGWGESDKPDRVLNISELADSLAAWIETMRIDRAVLVGHSFGCQVIAEFAVRHSEKIDRIVFAAPTMDERARNFLVVFARLLVNARNEPWSLIWLAIKSFFEFGLIRQIKTLKFALSDRIENRLPRVSAPTLVLCGERDTVVPQEWVEIVAGLLSDSETVTIAGGTHGFNYSSPEKFAEAIRGFLVRERAN